MLLDFGRRCDILWRRHLCVPRESVGAGCRLPSRRSTRTVRRAFVFGLAALLVCGIGVSAALAHSRLVRSEPPPRAVLDAAPKELKLWFNEPIEPAFAKLWLIPANGDKVALANHGDASDPRLLIGELPDNLPNGPVVIAYHVLSVDGHVVESQLTFSVDSAKTTSK